MPLPTEILEQIDEEYRDHPSLKDYNDVGSALKSLVETKAMVGNSVRRPGPDAGPEAQQKYWDALIQNDPELMKKPDFAEKDQSREFYRTLGLPEDEAGYTTPEGVDLPDEVQQELRGIGYKYNLTDSQMSGLLTEFSERQAVTNSTNTELHDSDMAQLKGKWGQAMDDRTKAAKQANEDFYPGRPFDSLTGGELESLYNISKAMTGKGAPAANDGGGIPSDAMTPGEATARADELLKRAQTAGPNDMSREERLALVNKSIELRVKYTGSDGSIDSLRA
jgi:hypothetical protein